MDGISRRKRKAGSSMEMEVIETNSCIKLSFVILIFSDN